MKLVMKVDPETNAPIVTEQGAVVYIDKDDNDKEMPLDPVLMYGKISNLNKENKGHRETNASLVTKYSLFDDIENPEEWKKKALDALDKVGNWNDADYVKQEKVEKLKADITSAFEDKLTAKDTAIADLTNTHQTTVDKLNGQVRRLMVSNKFSSSKYFGNDGLTTLHDPEIAESFFGRNFKVEVDNNGEPITRGYFNSGDPILSKVNPGEPAEFEEAIGLLIDVYPHKDSILKSSGGGSGAGGGSGSEDGGMQDLATLQKKHAEALKDGKTQLAITLKNQIFALQQKMRRAG